MSSLIDLTGQRFGRLTAKSRGPNDKWAQARWWCLCDCGNGVLIRSRDLKTGATKSCGCLYKDRIGEHSPNWQGGITSKRQQIYNSSKYRDWRSRVFERDDYICQKCGKRGVILNVHHIESFNNNPEFRTELSNGITLCKGCHQDFHHQYGYSCARKQLKRFFEEEDYENF